MEDKLTAVVKYLYQILDNIPMMNMQSIDKGLKNILGNNFKKYCIERYWVGMLFEEWFDLFKHECEERKIVLLDDSEKYKNLYNEGHSPEEAAILEFFSKDEWKSSLDLAKWDYYIKKENK